GLVARLGLFTAIMIIMGNMIGSGIFKKAAPMAEQVQSPGLLLLCWVIAGVVSFLGALSYAELAGIIAEPGGQYVYLQRAYGRFFAYLYGWASFAVIQTASISSIAYVFGQSANTLFHFPRLDAVYEQWSLFGIFYPLDNLGVKVFTVVAIAALSVANYYGVVFGGMIASVFTCLKLAGIALLIALGLTIGQGSAEHFTPWLAHPDAQYATNLGLFGAMFAAFLGAFWAYDGWNNITSLAAEVRRPKRNIPLALGLGTAGVMAVYLLVNAAYVYVMPVEEMAALTKQDNAIVAVEVMRKCVGPHGATFIAILILLSTFGATNCQLMPHSRVYFAMARDGLFLKGAAKCHPVYKTPSNSLVIQAVWASLLVFSGTFDQLTDMVIFASFIFYGATAFGVIVLRRALPDAPRPYKVTAYPFVPLFFVAFCAVLVVVTIYQSPRNAGIGLVLVLSGVPLYALWGRNSRVS
ncbi:MAG: amino acid permease, partial [Candidatus Hydrogenedentes bacterium]|nr:amino acid permease [Candidatus Hydrogenedentota bacterium]